MRIAALRNAKAKEWLNGRKHFFERLEQQLHQNNSPVVWVHSASTGEFEQAKPLIEAIRKRYPRYKILASFFSPSGYNAAANYAHIHYRCYLPLDTAHNARRLLQLARPSLVIFSKYDFWYHHLKAVDEAGVPLLLISALFRKKQAFFKWYGGFYKQMLSRFDHLFVQDHASLQLLQQHGINHCSVSGDTRFDRVLALRDQQPNAKIELIKQVIDDRDCVVAGSTWHGDENIISSVQTQFSNLLWIIVPHEINKAHIQQLSTLFPQHLLFTELETLAATPNSAKSITAANVLIVDAVGLLSSLYQLATVSYVGGGFTKDGVHNTLEAAVWCKPVVIGPNYKKYREAIELIDCGGALSVHDVASLAQTLNNLLHNKAALEAASEASEKYVARNGGATGKIMNYIQEKRLLTN